MLKSPNSNKRKKNNSYELGNNNLSVRFKKALSILLTTEYYEGSRYGKIYNKTRLDGKSQIYVEQPIIEKKLKDEFIKVEDDSIKFLVGPTGVGKTTLIRNMFQVFDRDVAVTDNNLIIYISFYSMVSYFDQNQDPYIVVQDAILGAFNEAISYLDGADYLRRMEKYDNNYYIDFYNFINSNNKHLIQTFPDAPDNVEGVKKQNGEKYILNWLKKNKPVDYRMSQLKYYLHLYEKSGKKMFDNIILILDDLESLDSIYTNCIIGYAYHCKKCLQAYDNRKYNFKTLVSMRNYSYRIQQIRRKEAFREIPWDDVILKDTVPELSKVIEKRANYVLELDEVINSVDNRIAFQVATENLRMVLLKMYGHYDQMLLSLTHNNVFKSMALLFRILTNKAHMGRYEIDRVNQNGAFDISARDYYVENSAGNSRIPGNDEVFYALVYGEQKLYFDCEDYYMTNIMHYKYKENISTELLGIYIIQYFIKQGINMDDSSYDGLETILSKQVIDDIICLFNFSTDERAESIKKGLGAMMEHLYKGGVLLQSITEPIAEDMDTINRNYLQDMKVYLSLRGSQLYNMLSYNALLLTTYRDDIDTDIEKNDIPSLDMSMDDRMIYCIRYINQLSVKEIELFREVSDYENYKSILGDELVVVKLMRGIKETIKIYFLNDTQSKQEIIRQYQLVQNRVNDFLDSIYEESSIMFKHIDSI